MKAARLKRISTNKSVKCIQCRGKAFSGKVKDYLSILETECDKSCKKNKL